MRLVRAVLILSSSALVVPGAVLSAGTLLPGIPYVGTVGSWMLPASPGRFLVLGLVGATLASGARRLGARRIGTALLLFGVFTATAAATVIGSHSLVAHRNGVRVDVLAPLLSRGRATAATPDTTVTYTHVDGRRLEMDIYRPPRQTRRAPVVLYTHGGGWIRGHRAVRSATLRWFADRGFVAFSPDYVLATASAPTWNTASAQIACAMTWIARHAEAHGGDPRRMVAFGESAGGALALTAAYAAAAGVARSSCGGDVPTVRAVAAEYPAVDPVTFHDNPDPLRRDAARQMVASYLGGSPHDHPDRAQAVSSATYITPKAPPTLIFLVSNDHLVPIAGTLQFIERASQAGVAVRSVQFPWADHSVNAEQESIANQAMRQIMLQHFCQHVGDCVR